MAKKEFGKGLKSKFQAAVDNAKAVAKDVKIPEIKPDVPDLKSKIAEVKKIAKTIIITNRISKK